MLISRIVPDAIRTRIDSPIATHPRIFAGLKRCADAVFVLKLSEHCKSLPAHLPGLPLLPRRARRARALAATPSSLCAPLSWDLGPDSVSGRDKPYDGQQTR